MDGQRRESEAEGGGEVLSPATSREQRSSPAIAGSQPPSRRHSLSSSSFYRVRTQPRRQRTCTRCANRTSAGRRGRTHAHYTHATHGARRVEGGGDVLRVTVASVSSTSRKPREALHRRALERAPSARSHHTGAPTPCTAAQRPPSHAGSVLQSSRRRTVVVPSRTPFHMHGEARARARPGRALAWEPTLPSTRGDPSPRAHTHARHTQ